MRRTVSRPAPSPLEPFDHPAAARAGVQLYVKRDDLYTLAPGTALQGNKVRKLWPVLQAAHADPSPRLHYSFGGAYSNHVAALAVAVSDFDLRAVAFVRGEEVDNPLLRNAAARGLRLIRVSRSDYRRRADPDWLREQESRLAREYDLSVTGLCCIPEGGTSQAAADSAGDAYRETLSQLGRPPDYFCLSAGTGGTAAGIILAAHPDTYVEVFPALKGNWMAEEIRRWLPVGPADNWACVTGYAFGGYGKFPAEWILPAPGLAKRADIGWAGLPPLEPVYTAKLFVGVLERVEAGAYPPGSRVVVLHTGGIY